MLTLMLHLTSILAVVYSTSDFSWFSPIQESSYDIFGSGLNLTGFDYDAWWGPSEHGQDDTSIKDFKVVFDNEMIQDLKYRLKHRRPIPPSLKDSWFNYGINSQVAEDWLNYWENGYPFQEREDYLNKFPQYVTNIQGLDIHFVRVRPEVPENVEVVPLLVISGFPTTFAEFYEAMPRLTEWDKERDFAVEVIAPSIPGFIFSEATVRPGLGAPEAAVIFRKLMHRLGHKTYYLGGNGLSYYITDFIATAYPEDVRGLTSGDFTPLSLVSVIPILNNSTVSGRTMDDYLHQLTYLPHQAATPDTLGIAMNGSPSGLLGYILEFFYFSQDQWRKENAGTKIEKTIPRDIILDDIMLYWKTGCIGTSMRMYAETFNKRVLAMNIDGTPSPVLTSITKTKFAIGHLPEWVARKKYPNLISYKTLDFGGHFFNYEYPDEYANGLLEAITSFRKKADSS